MSRDFEHAYAESLREIAPRILPRHCEFVARHNRGWSPRPDDVIRYLEQSVHRYAIANDAIVAGRAKGPFVDIGGFWGVFPLALRKLGHEVAITETLRFYDDAFDGIFGLLKSQRVAVHDVDPFSGEDPALPTFGTGFCMAVLEHYPHSLRGFFGTVNALIRAGGMLYVEVPNMARWGNRMALLRGESVLPPSDVVFRSEVPFTGHHREYTLGDLDRALAAGGWAIRRSHAYTYSTRFTWKSWLVSPAWAAADRFFPMTREVISAECSRA